MASLVIWERNGVVVEWNKQAAWSVTSSVGRREYPTKEKAIAAAKRAARKHKGKPNVH